MISGLQPELHLQAAGPVQHPVECSGVGSPRGPRTRGWGHGKPDQQLDRPRYYSFSFSIFSLSSLMWILWSRCEASAWKNDKRKKKITWRLEKPFERAWGFCKPPYGSIIDLSFHIHRIPGESIRRGYMQIQPLSRASQCFHDLDATTGGHQPLSTGTSCSNSPEHRWTISIQYPYNIHTISKYFQMYQWCWKKNGWCDAWWRSLKISAEVRRVQVHLWRGQREAQIHRVFLWRFSCSHISHKAPRTGTWPS